MFANLKWVDFLLLLFALILMTFGIGSYGLYEPHEGHLAMVGYEMVLRGDHITPTLNGAPYLNKPPLLYWLIASSIKLIGINELAVRLPLAIAGWLGIAIAMKWTRELWGVDASRIVVLMLSVTFGWFIFTHQLLIEVLLGTLVLASNYFLWRWLCFSCWWDFWFFYVCLGLGILTKGLVGLILPLIGCFGLCLVEQNWQTWRKIRPLQGTIIILTLVLPWFVAVELANPGFLHYFIVNEHLNRIFDIRYPPDYEVAKISFLGYLAITAIWCLPWSLFFFPVCKFTWQEWQYSSKKNYRWGIYLLAIAAVTPVLLFLPLSSRLIYYSIPAVPPYVMLCGGWWFRLHQSEDKQLKLLGTILIGLGLASLGIIFLLPYRLKSLTAIDNRIDVTLLIVATSIVLGIGWLIAGISWLRRDFPLCLRALVTSLIITYISVTLGFSIYQYIRSSKILMKTAIPCLSFNTLWVFEGSREIGAAGGMSYYLNRGRYYSLSTTFSGVLELPAGWVEGKKDRVYRQVLILSDGGENRLPPRFPGALPSYLITKQELQTYWNSDRPVVLIADFLRQPNDPQDPPDLNLPQNAGKPLLTVGPRKLYGNQAARERWCNRS